VTVAASFDRLDEPRANGDFPGLRSASPSGPTIVRLHDGLDLAAAPALRERLIDVLHRAAGLFVLDLSAVSSCDVAGLAVLIGTQRRARLSGITMRLAAPSAPVRAALRSSGLERSFTICSDLSGALAAQGREPAEAVTASTFLAAVSSF
jgi:anti-sigma B factor antagonist